MFGAVTAGVAAAAIAPLSSSTRPGRSLPRQATVVSLVVGIKSQEHAEALLAQAFAVATERHLDLVVLHAWELPDAYMDLIEQRTQGAHWLAEATVLLEQLLSPWRSQISRS